MYFSEHFPIHFTQFCPNIELCVRKFLAIQNYEYFPIFLGKCLKQHRPESTLSTRNFPSKVQQWKALKGKCFMAGQASTSATMYLPLTLDRFGIKFSGGKTNAFLGCEWVRQRERERLCLQFSALWRYFLRPEIWKCKYCTRCCLMRCLDFISSIRRKLLHLSTQHNFALYNMLTTIA